MLVPGSWLAGLLGSAGGVVHFSGRNVGVFWPAVGAIGGSELMLPRVPSGPVLPGQQLPRLTGCSSHMKSRPFRARFGREFSVVLLPNLSSPGCGRKPG